MKLYDFSNGVKGEQVGDALNYNFVIYDQDHLMHDICYKLAKRVEKPFGKIRQSLTFPYGCKSEAICFCTGQNSSGGWNWVVLAKDGWVEKMVESGVVIKL